MENQAQQDDELLMSLVEQALAQPEDQRQTFLESACAGDRELFEQAWNYVSWDQRMQGFLLEPLVSPSSADTARGEDTRLITPVQNTAGAA